MTYEEAKALFEEDLKEGKCSDDCPECNARELAIIALEKQIPKRISTKFYDCGSYDYICTSCGYVIDIDNKMYCEHCGQALYWSDDNAVN